MLSIEDKRRILDEIDAASPESLRRALTKVLCHYYARGAWAEEHFAELTRERGRLPRKFVEGVVGLEVCELLAGGLSPCSQPGCDRASFFCRIHEQKPRSPIPVSIKVRMDP